MKKCRLLLAAGLLMFLTGCFSQSVEEFYAPPKAPDDYLKLDNEINKVLTQGGEYAAPLSGELTQKVQLQDLDGDGVQEAIAFFRVSADERPLKIYIYRQVGENYEVAAVIEGSGNAIDSIYYENLDDSPSKELIVDWETAGQRHSLAAYSIDRYEVLELMRTDHAGFQIYDVDGDGQKEILVLQMAAGEVGQAESFVNSAPGSRVEVYNFRDGILELDASAPLSNGVEKLVSMKTGYLQNMAPALFVTSTYAENGQITDIFAWKNGGLENVTLEPDTGESDSTIRWSTEVESTKVSQQCGDGPQLLGHPLVAVRHQRGFSSGIYHLPQQPGRLVLCSARGVVGEGDALPQRLGGRRRAGRNLFLLGGKRGHSAGAVPGHLQADRRQPRNAGQHGRPLSPAQHRGGEGDHLCRAPDREWLGLRLGRGGRKGQFRPNYQRLAPTADACVRKEETG